MIRQWWAALRRKGSHRGLYRPLPHWKCATCTSDCHCPIVLPVLLRNVHVYDIGQPDRSVTVDFSLGHDSGLMTVPVLVDEPQKELVDA